MADRIQIYESDSQGGPTGRVLSDFGEWLDQLRPIIVLAAAVLLVLGVAVADYATGDEISVSIFYLGPVVLATWFVSEWAGVSLSLFGALLWTALDSGIGNYSNSLIPFWNTLVHVAFFLVTVFLVTITKRAISSERAASRTDPLTGVANGRAFSDRASLALAEMHRSRNPMTFCYLDLDHFKAVNDTLGHREGDELLRVLASALKSRLRSTDMVARLGGDEFGVLLPDTDYDAAEKALTSLSVAMHEAVATRWPVSLTCGAVTFVQPPPGVDMMVSVADELMYEGKRSGRARIDHVIWPSESAVGMRDEVPEVAEA
jgi:diguanylate cyclase (GGDEF)-like protein